MFKTLYFQGLDSIIFDVWEIGVLRHPQLPSPDYQLSSKLYNDLQETATRS